MIRSGQLGARAPHGAPRDDDPDGLCRQVDPVEEDVGRALEPPGPVPRVQRVRGSEFRMLRHGGDRRPEGVLHANAGRRAILVPPGSQRPRSADAPSARPVLSPGGPELANEILRRSRLACRDLVLGPPERGVKPGAFVVGHAPEWLDPVQACVRIARIPQVLQVAPCRLLLACGKRIDQGVEVLSGGVAHAGILATRARVRHHRLRRSWPGGPKPPRRGSPFRRPG